MHSLFGDLTKKTGILDAPLSVILALEMQISGIFLNFGEDMTAFLAAVNAPLLRVMLMNIILQANWTYVIAANRTSSFRNVRKVLPRGQYKGVRLYSR